MSRTVSITSLLLSATVALFCPSAGASTVLSASILEEAKDAKVIVAGSVLKKTTTEIRSGMPWTCFGFLVSEVIKGPATPNKKLKLCFLGGSHGGRVLAVSGMQMLREGEQNILFLEDPQRPLMSPLYGWSQGLFQVLKVGTREFVANAQGRPVSGVDIQIANRLDGDLSAGTARGILLSDMDHAVSPQEFVAIIKSLAKGDVP